MTCESIAQTDLKHTLWTGNQVGFFRDRFQMNIFALSRSFYFDLIIPNIENCTIPKLIIQLIIHHHFSVISIEYPHISPDFHGIKMIQSLFKSPINPQVATVAATKSLGLWISQSGMVTRP